MKNNIIEVDFVTRQRVEEKAKLSFWSRFLYGIKDLFPPSSKTKSNRYGVSDYRNIL